VRTPLRSRGRSPEGSKSRGSAGAETLRSVFSEAAFRRPRAVACRAEGATSAATGLRSHPGYSLSRTMLRSGPLAAALLDHLSRAAAEGRPCSVLPRLHSLDRRPRNPRELISRRRCERKATPPQPGTDLAPLQTLSCCVPRVGQGCGQYGGGGEGGDKLAALGPKSGNGRFETHEVSIPRGSCRALRAAGCVANAARFTVPCRITRFAAARLCCRGPRA